MPINMPDLDTKFSIGVPVPAQSPMTGMNSTAWLDASVW